MMLKGAKHLSAKWFKSSETLIGRSALKCYSSKMIGKVPAVDQVGCVSMHHYLSSGRK